MIQHKIKTFQEIQHFIQGSIRSTNKFIKDNQLLTIKKGVYTTCKNHHPYNILKYLDDTSYVSLESGLSYYGVLQKNTEIITAVTRKTRKIIHNDFGTYTFRAIKRKDDGEIKYIADGDFYIGSLEKCIADYLFFSDIRLTENIVKSVQKNNFKTVAIREIMSNFTNNGFNFCGKNINLLKLQMIATDMNKKTLCLSKILQYYLENKN